MNWLKQLNPELQKNKKICDELIILGSTFEGESEPESVIVCGTSVAAFTFFHKTSQICFSVGCGEREVSFRNGFTSQIVKPFQIENGLVSVKGSVVSSLEQIFQIFTGVKQRGCQ